MNDESNVINLLNKVECDEKVYSLFDAFYRYRGNTFSFYFYALDFKDAQRRIEAMRESVFLNGKVSIE